MRDHLFTLWVRVAEIEQALLREPDKAELHQTLRQLEEEIFDREDR